MKRLSLAIIFACFTLVVAAQEGFRVDYQGTRPTIKDFVKAYLTSILSEEVEECEEEGMAIYRNLQSAITNKEKGLPLDVTPGSGYNVTYPGRLINGDRSLNFYKEENGKRKSFGFRFFVWFLCNGGTVLLYRQVL